MSLLRNTFGSRSWLLSCAGAICGYPKGEHVRFGAGLPEGDLDRRVDGRPGSASRSLSASSLVLPTSSRSSRRKRLVVCAAWNFLLKRAEDNGVISAVS